MGECVASGGSTAEQGTYLCQTNADAMHLASDLEAEGYLVTVVFRDEQYHVEYRYQPE